MTFKRFVWRMSVLTGFFPLSSQTTAAVYSEIDEYARMEDISLSNLVCNKIINARGTIPAAALRCFYLSESESETLVRICGAVWPDPSAFESERGGPYSILYEQRNLKDSTNFPIEDKPLKFSVRGIRTLEQFFRVSESFINKYCPLERAPLFHSNP